MAMQSDDDDSFIHSSEAYRRAKRNVLFWATATALLAIGTSISPGPVEVDLVFKQLRFPGGLLTVLSLVALAFMFAGYVRAEARHLSQHTGLAYGRRMHELAEAAAAAQEAIQERRNRLANISARKAPARTAVELAIAKFRARFEQLSKKSRSDIEVLQEQLNRVKQALLREGKAIEPVSVSWLITEYNRASQGAFKLATKFVNSTGEHFAAVAEQAAKDISGFEFPTDATEEDAEQALVAELRAIVADIRGFAKSIAPSQHLWFRWYDRFPVWLATALAFEIALFRLFAPAKLAAGVSAAF